MPGAIPRMAGFLAVPDISAMIEHIFILILLGGLFELDRTAAIQSLASEPIVVAPVVGWIIGEPMLGLKLGVLMQLFFLGNVSIGGSTPPDGTLAALVVAGSAGLSGAGHTVSIEALATASALTLMIPASRLGCFVENLLKEQNVALAHNADDRVLKEGAKVIEKIVHRRLFSVFLIWAGVSALALGMGAIVLNLAFRFMPDEVSYALESAGQLLPLIAAGVALSAIKVRRANWYFAAGCIVLLIISAGIGKL